MLLGLDGSLDDINVEDVGNQRDGDVVRSNSSFQSGSVMDIEADGLGVGETSSKLLGRLDGSASDGDMHTSLGEHFNGRGGNEASAEEEGGLRHCDCWMVLFGLVLVVQSKARID